MPQTPMIPLSDGVAIPQLGFGVWRVSSETVVPAVSEALRVGYRHIDTAKLYANEEGVGKAVRSSGLPRSEVFITTKVWNDDHGYDPTRRAFDASLARLGFDYVDLYLIHWPMPRHDRYLETWRAMETIQREGRARAIGVSNFTPQTLRRLADHAETLPSINQVELHPTFQQRELRELHDEMGIVTEAWSPLGKSRDLDDPVVRRIAERVGHTPAQVVLRWHLQSGIVAIPKSVTPSRIAENADVFEFQLGTDDMAELATIDRGHRIGPDPDAMG
jgi:2,5-diketo-D-gluconate reductase A